VPVFDDESCANAWPASRLRIALVTRTFFIRISLLFN
jgi:hypothetical protein